MVEGERLLPPGAGGRDVRPEVADGDPLALVLLLVGKHTDPVLAEPADGWGEAEPAVPAARPVQRPLVALLVVQPQGHPAEPLGGEQGLVEIGDPVQGVPGPVRTREPVPVLAAHQHLAEPALLRGPRPHEPVERVVHGRSSPVARIEASHGRRHRSAASRRRDPGASRAAQAWSGLAASVNSPPCAAADPALPPPLPRSTNAASTASIAPAIGPTT